MNQQLISKMECNPRKQAYLWSVFGTMGYKIFFHPLFGYWHILKITACSQTVNKLNLFDLSSVHTWKSGSQTCDFFITKKLYLLAYMWSYALLPVCEHIIWFKVRSYLIQNLLVSSFPFLYTLHAFFNDVFPIYILCHSVTVLKHVIIYFTLPLFMLPIQCSQGFFFLLCVWFCFSSICILFCSSHKEQLPISTPLLIHLNFQIPYPLSVHSTTVCSQVCCKEISCNKWILLRTFFNQ
jgi:hypothetical protein